MILSGSGTSFELLAVIFQDFQTNLSELLAVILQARENTKRIRDGIVAEFGRVRRAGCLFFRGALK